MSNPWLKKNPFMSMWLTAANKATGTARGHATSAVKKQVAVNQAEAARQIVDFWTGKPARAAKAAKPAAARKRSR